MLSLSEPLGGNDTSDNFRCSHSYFLAKFSVSEGRESSIIWFLIFVLVLKYGYYNIVQISLGFV